MKNTGGHTPDVPQWTSGIIPWAMPGSQGHQQSDPLELYPGLESQAKVPEDGATGLC